MGALAALSLLTKGSVNEYIPFEFGLSSPSSFQQQNKNILHFDKEPIDLLGFNKNV